MIMIMIANSQLVFLYRCGLFFSCSLASLNTVSGINFIDSAISAGTIIKSSNKPKTGIKSDYAQFLVEIQEGKFCI